MTDDPDELRMEQALARKDPARAGDALEAIEAHIRYGLPTLKLIGWLIVVLLGLVLWRIW